MCEKAVEDKPETLEFVPEHFKSLEMCERAVESSKDPWQVNDVLDHFKTEKMCERAVEKSPWCLK